MSGAAETVTVVEVSPRDGLQNEKVELSTAEKCDLIARAVGFGARRVEVTSFVHPAKVPAMADAERVCAGLPAGRAEYSALILNERGLERAIAAGITEINAVVHCTDMFSLRNQGVDVDGGVRIWRRIAERAADTGVTANLTVAAAFGCPFEGEVSVRRLAELVDAVSTHPPAELSLADTIGVAVPRDVRVRVGVVSDLLGPDTTLRAHFHDTRNCGIGNALEAVEAGVTILDASLGGIGGCPFAPGATGNIATEDLAYALGRSGVDHGLDAAALAGAGRWLEGVFGRRLPAGVLHSGGFPSPQAERTS